MATADTRLMIEGTLAQTYTRMDGRTGSTKMVTVDVGDLPPSENPGLWCHTIAIRRGMIYDPYHVAPPQHLGSAPLLERQQHRRVPR
jgi:hypothetical protein